MGKELIMGLDLGIASPCGVAVINYDTEKLLFCFQVEQPFSKGRHPTEQKIMAMVDAVDKACRDIWPLSAWCGFEAAPFMQNRKIYGDMARLSGALMWMLRSRGVGYQNISVSEAKGSLGLAAGKSDKADVQRMVRGIYGESIGAVPEHAADAVAVARATVLRIKNIQAEMKAAAFM